MCEANGRRSPSDRGSPGGRLPITRKFSRPLRTTIGDTPGVRARNALRSRENINDFMRAKLCAAYRMNMGKGRCQPGAKRRRPYRVVEWQLNVNGCARGSYLRSQVHVVTTTMEGKAPYKWQRKRQRKAELGRSVVRASKSLRLVFSPPCALFYFFITRGAIGRPARATSRSCLRRSSKRGAPLGGRACLFFPFLPIARHSCSPWPS